MIQVTLDTDGYASYVLTRMSMLREFTVLPSGVVVFDQTEINEEIPLNSSGRWSKKFAEKYASSLPSNILATMEEAKFKD